MLTKPGRGDIVGVGTSIARLLVALLVGRWFGQRRAFVAVAPGVSVHTLDNSRMQALAACGRTLEQRLTLLRTPRKLIQSLTNKLENPPNFFI